MQTRQTYRQFIEVLEPRTLFAYVAADYVPLTPRTTWDYDGFLNRTATANSVAPSANPVGVETHIEGYAIVWITSFPVGIDVDPNPPKQQSAVAAQSSIKVTRIRDTLTGSDNSTTTFDRYFANDGRRGVRRYGFSLGGAANATGTITQNNPIPLLPRTFNTGTVSQWSNLQVASQLTIPGSPIQGQTVLGTDSGFTIVNPDQDRTTLNGLTLLQTIEVITQQTQRYTYNVSGQSYSLRVNVSEQLFMARGVGVLKGFTTLQFSVVGPNVNMFLVFSEQYEQLNQSSLLSSFTRTTGSTLRVGGSAGDDVIGAGFDGNNILVVRNGIGFSTPASGITRIVIDAAAGNDVVGPLKLGRMKSNLIGGLGNDYVTGGSGRDYILGGAGDDTLVGGPGLDTLFGDAGDDILNGLNGADSLDGGDGKDTTKLDNNDVARIAIEVLI